MKRVMQDLLTYTPIISGAENSFLRYIYPSIWYCWIDFDCLCAFHMVFKCSEMIGLTLKFLTVTIDVNPES